MCPDMRASSQTEGPCQALPGQVRSASFDVLIRPDVPYGTGLAGLYPETGHIRCWISTAHSAHPPILIQQFQATLQVKVFRSPSEQMESNHQLVS